MKEKALFKIFEGLSFGKKIKNSRQGKYYNNQATRVIPFLLSQNHQ